MAKRLTVFYSWQSDSPQPLNRSFIEEALLEALKRLNSDATLEKALRETPVELDKDIQGVAGSPPIADTILRKIENCAVFVADLSFVGESKSGFTNASGKPRQFPNPNVLIEYGYALRCHSHTKLIGVMNTAQGSPDAESIPFDLRHLLWPISYYLADASAAGKSNQFENLVIALVKAIGLILANHTSPIPVVEQFVPQKHTKNAAIFFDNAADLTDRSDTFEVPDGAKMFLRLYPTIAVPPINTELEARSIAQRGSLEPMGQNSGRGVDRNIFGAMSLDAPMDGKLCHFTQLFLSREIWGVDAHILNAEYLANRQKSWNQQPPYKPWIANGYVEQYFVEALRNYIRFAQTHLKLPVPLRIEAGMIGIKNYPIATSNNWIGGKALHDAVLWRSEILSYDKPAWEILGPFFDRVWDNCGLQRTPQQQAALAKGFGG